MSMECFTPPIRESRAVERAEAVQLVCLGLPCLDRRWRAVLRGLRGDGPRDELRVEEVLENEVSALGGRIERLLSAAAEAVSAAISYTFSMRRSELAEGDIWPALLTYEPR